jgi:mRNA interferase RelE/StbE
VLLKSSVADRIEGIDPSDRSAVREGVAGLGREPRPPAAEQLPGYADRFRLRYGHYRILYQIDDLREIVTVFGVEYRRPQGPC